MYVRLNKPAGYVTTYKDLDGAHPGARISRTRVNKVSGTVRGPDGRLASEAAVIVFPALPAAWGPTSMNAGRFLTANTAADGTYELRGVLPGDYLLAAVPIEDRVRGSEPAFMTAIAGRATRVTVGPNSVLSHADRHRLGRRHRLAW